MKRVDKTVLAETGYIAMWVVIFSTLMQAVFLIAGGWNVTVLFGNLLGAAAAVLNFFLMGLTVQSATARGEKDAKALMKLSQSLRTLMMFGAAVLGAVLPCFQIIASLLPLFFPRIAIAFRPLFMKRKKRGDDTSEK